MKTPSKSLLVLFITLALAFSFTTSADALSLGETVISGDFSITGIDVHKNDLDIYELISMSDNGPTSTSGLTTGTIWSELNGDGISEAWALEFALNSNQTGGSTLEVNSLSLSFDGMSFATDGTNSIGYDNGGSDYEALFRVDLPFNFMTEYRAISSESFTLTALHGNAWDGADVYSLNSVTVTPEPLSTVLFLLGGAPMAAALYRKRRKA